MAKITAEQLGRINKSFAKLVSLFNDYGLCHGKLRESFLEYKLSIARFLAHPSDTELPKDLIAALYWITTYHQVVSSVVGEPPYLMTEETYLGTLIVKAKNILVEIFKMYFNELNISDGTRDFMDVITIVFEKQETINAFVEEISEMFRLKI